jgi:hypothetical protein
MVTSMSEESAASIFKMFHVCPKGSQTTIRLFLSLEIGLRTHLYMLLFSEL